MSENHFELARILLNYLKLEYSSRIFDILGTQNTVSTILSENYLELARILLNYLKLLYLVEQ